MCTNPPPAPPPPPPVLPNVSSLVLPATNEITATFITSDSNDCLWASEHLELREACLKNRICLHTAPYKYSYKHFQSIIQVGPTCGLVALSMTINNKVTAEEMLNISKLEGYSSNGEMFSCKNMANLAEKVFRIADITNVGCSVKTGGLFSMQTVESLLDGAVLLVPYDADCNHSPCLRHGHTAHWALICGVIIINEPGVSNKTEGNNVYVFSKHGKSRYLSAWNLSELDKSNNNLWEFSPKKGTDGLVYVLPDGGIAGKDGLRGQFLMFQGLK